MNEQAEGMDAPGGDGQLVWREAPEQVNGHIEVAVADGADGRFVPGPFTVRVHVDPPSFMRPDPRNGKRYAETGRRRLRR